MTILTPEEIAYLVQSAGFPQTTLTGHNQRADVTAVAIALCESGGDTEIEGDNGNSIGLFQIHVPTWGRTFPKSVIDSLKDPAVNTATAFTIFQFAGRKFTDWSCYKNGGYVRHLTAAAKAVQSPKKPASTGGRVTGFSELGIASGNISNPLDALRAIGDILGFITDPENWKRVGLFIGGGVLIIIGVVLWAQESGVAQSAVKTAANVVPVGRAAGAVGKTARAARVAKKATS